MSDAPPPRSTRGDGEWKPPAPPTLQRVRENLPPVGRIATSTEKPTRVDPAPPAFPARNAPPLGMPLPPKNVPPTQNIPIPQTLRPTAAPANRAGAPTVNAPGIPPTGAPRVGAPPRPGMPMAPNAPAPISPTPARGGRPPLRVVPGSPGAPVAAQAPSHITLRQLVQEAFDNNYSDIHLGVGEIPRFRDRGQMLPTNHPVTTTEMFYDWMREGLPEGQIRQFEECLELDTAIQYEGLVRCRVNVFVSLLGPALVMRLIPIKILSLEQLRAPDILRTISEQHKGLVLVTGPTGSGKSTTMAAMIDYINTNFPKHIISIEDPVEFVHQSKKSMIRQREVGIHTLEFGNALKASLREDPDVILIGEMRDRETVDTAIKAAQTGHLVFGTLHTNSAVKTIERLLGIYRPEEQAPMRMQLAETLVAIVAQTLVRSSDGKRCAAHEILRNTDAIRDYIHRGAVDEIEELLFADSYEGMQTMNQSLFNLYQEGRITEDVCMDAAPKPNEMAQWLRGRM